MEYILLNLFMIIFILMLLGINYIKQKSLTTITQIHNMMWLIAFLLYLFNYIGFYPLDYAVYFYCLTYLFCFNVVAFSYSYPIKKYIVENKQAVCDLFKSEKYDQRCLMFSIFGWLLSYRILQKSLPILLGSGSLSTGMNLLRYQTYSDISIFNTFELMLLTYIIRPIFTVTILYFALKLASNNLNKKITLIAMLDALFLVAMTAGRALIISMVIYSLIAILLFNKINFISIIKRYKKYLWILLPSLVFFIFISIQRVNRDNSVITELFLYIFSGLPYFSIMLKSNIAVPYSLLGKGTFSTIIDPIFLFIKFFGFDLNLGSQFISNITNTTIEIGQNIQMNAVSSILTTFYVDFGFIGVAFGGVLMGLVTIYIERKLMRKMSPKYFVIYLYVFCAIIMSIQNYSFLGSATFFVFLFIIVMFR